MNERKKNILAGGNSKLTKKQTSTVPCVPKKKSHHLSAQTVNIYNYIKNRLWFSYFFFFVTIYQRHLGNTIKINKSSSSSSSYATKNKKNVKLGSNVTKK